MIVAVVKVLLEFELTVITKRILAGAVRRTLQSGHHAHRFAAGRDADQLRTDGEVQLTVFVRTLLDGHGEHDLEVAVVALPGVIR